jgi:hypothetical protein
MGADLKPDNVLLTGDDTAKLGDFGLARYQQGSQLDTGEAGTANYMAWCDTTPDHPEKLDVYSLGMTLWAIFTERVPFAGVGAPELRQWVMAGRRPSLDDTGLTNLPCGAQLKDLISRCWHQDKLMRPSAAAVVRDLHSIYPGTPSDLLMNDDEYMIFGCISCFLNFPFFYPGSVISWQKLDCGCLVGRGTHSEVRKARLQGVTVAVKVSEATDSQFLAEVAMLRSARTHARADQIESADTFGGGGTAGASTT